MDGGDRKDVDGGDRKDVIRTEGTGRMWMWTVETGMMLYGRRGQE